MRATLFVAVLALASNATAQRPAGNPLVTFHGKGYRMLLRQFKVPEDQKKLGDFHVKGASNESTHRGHTELPAGHWVYVAPYWFIYRDKEPKKPPFPNWSPEQVIGNPDCPGGSDNVKAWATMLADKGEEWLMVEYAEPVLAARIQIHESFNPGAITRVVAFGSDGRETEVYKNNSPKAAGAKRVLEIPLVGNRTMRLQIFLAANKVKGWNEIDAVGLVDKNGKTHWAESAAASTWYDVRPAAKPVFFPAPVVRGAIPQVAKKVDKRDKRIKQLERMIAELQRRIAELEARLAKVEKKK